MTAKRVRFLDLDFDRLTLAEAIEWIDRRDPAASFAYVVTPNVDHMVRLAKEPAGSAVREAYDAAALCLCDSRILARLARLRNLALPVVAGSDLTAALLTPGRCAGDRLCLVGGSDQVVSDLRARLPDCEILHHQPPMGLRNDPAAIAAAVDAVIGASARLVLLAVGSPQQELLARAIAAAPDARGTGLCIGASIDFITGARARAPRIFQRAGLEWLHRLLSEPRRLWRRYLIEGPRIFLLVWRWRKPR